MCRGSSLVERRPEKAGVASSILAPGTIRTSAKQVPVPSNSESRSFRRERYGCAVLRELSLGSGHVGGEEHRANIPQTLLNKRLDLLEPSIEPAAVSPEEFFADIVEPPLTLPQLIEQRRGSMSFRDGIRQAGYLGLEFLPLVSHEG
jgi:hypothetical protein